MDSEGVPKLLSCPLQKAPSSSSAIEARGGDFHLAVEVECGSVNEAGMCLISRARAWCARRLSLLHKKAVAQKWDAGKSPSVCSSFSPLICFPSLCSSSVCLHPTVKWKAAVKVEDVSPAFLPSFNLETLFQHQWLLLPETRDKKAWPNEGESYRTAESGSCICTLQGQGRACAGTESAGQVASTLWRWLMAISATQSR